MPLKPTVAGRYLLKASIARAALSRYFVLPVTRHAYLGCSKLVAAVWAALFCVHVALQHFGAQDIIADDSVKSVLIVESDVIFCWVGEAGEVSVRRDVCESFRAYTSSVGSISSLTLDLNSKTKKNRTPCSDMCSCTRQLAQVRTGRSCHCSKVCRLHLHCQYKAQHAEETNLISSCRRGNR